MECQMALTFVFAFTMQRPFAELNPHRYIVLPFYLPWPGSTPDTEQIKTLNACTPFTEHDDKIE